MQRIDYQAISNKIQSCIEEYKQLEQDPTSSSRNSKKLEYLINHLQEACSGSLSITAQEVSTRPTSKSGTLSVEVIGPDRPGIIQEVTQVFANAKQNILNLNSDISTAAMTGTPMFKAEVLIAINAELDIASLEEQLATSALTLGVDIQLAQTEDI